jgi:hypothetical protein
MELLMRAPSSVRSINLFVATFVMQLLLAAVPASAQSPAAFEPLMKKVPDGANVLVIFNVEQILKSTYAMVHNSEEKLKESFAQRGILIPPDATQFVMAEQYDLEHLRLNWAAAVIGLKKPIDFDRFAALGRHTVESLSGLQGIGMSKAFALNLGDKQLGLFIPSNRQQAARWAQQLKHSSQPLSPYLAQAGSYGDTAGTDIILAIDLADVFPPQWLNDRIRYLLRDSKVDIGKAAAILSKAQGARLGIKIGLKCNAMLVVDLQDDPAILADVVKPLSIEVLGNSGLLLDEMKQWKPAVGKKTISLQGELTEDGMRQIMGVVELPPDAPGMTDGGAAGATAGTSESLKRDASQKYFKAVQQRLDSLRLQKQDAKTMGQMAMWIDSAARGIDRMPVLNVDDELLDYSTTVSNELRQIVASLQGVGIQTGAQAAQIYSTDSYYYDDGTNVQGARRAVKAQEKAEGATSSLEMSRVIASQSAAIRRKMSEKYQVEF